MSRIVHSLVGYDRRTERVAEEFDLPDAMLPRAKELAQVPSDDPEAVMCYALDASRAHELAQILKARIDTERCDYFLEGFEPSGTE
jgi:broad specificity phosphatase PhoE